MIQSKSLTRSRIFGALIVSLTALTVLAQDSGVLPRWTSMTQAGDSLLRIELPAQLKDTPQRRSNLDALVLTLDSSWNPDWRQASFDVKNMIISIKSAAPSAQVGIEATEAQINGLLANEMAPYLDGYIYSDTPYIPDADETGKLWLRADVDEAEVLNTLLDAASIGVERVLFEKITIGESHRAMLDTIAATSTGSLDIQPELTGLDPEKARFFFEPGSGAYHMAVYAPEGRASLIFAVGSDVKVTALYPENASFETQQYGSRTEISIPGGVSHYFFLLEPSEPAGTTESIEIVGRKNIDPYELVVRNQVFKEGEERKLNTLIVDELTNYLYQTPGGIGIDVTFLDTIYIRKDEPIERVRKEFYIAGVKWRRDKLPELPLIQPEKVQSAPLNVELDKTYRYTYLGEGDVGGFRCWRVRFEPTEEGDFFSGVVWIDQETGAHRKIRAIQSGLEAPVLGNEITATYDWAEDNGMKYWTQVKEENLQIINIAGNRIALQIDAVRSNFRFNRTNAREQLQAEYESDRQMLRDTEEGFRYLTKKDGSREISQDDYTRRRALLGGVLFDPATDEVTPLLGLNYTDLDFLDRGWQANFFVAGAVNDLIVSNPDFLGKGWDLTGELFLSAIKFGDRIFQGGEERKDLELEELRESLNITLGIPIGSFWKFSANYGLQYSDFSEADDTNPEYVLPVETLSHIGRINLEYSRRRFTTALQYEVVKRADWEAFGLPGFVEPLEDTYSTLQWDATITKRLPKFQNLSADIRFLKGWNQDRFSRFGFGFFENRVSGFGSSGAEGDQAVRVRFEYEVGVKGLFNIDISLDGARAWLDDTDPFISALSDEDAINLGGIGIAANVLGPWGTLIRADIGYGLFSDLEDEEGDIAGQIVFLKLF